MSTIADQIICDLLQELEKVPAIKKAIDEVPNNKWVGVVTKLQTLVLMQLTQRSPSYISQIESSISSLQQKVVTIQSTCTRPRKVS